MREGRTPAGIRPSLRVDSFSVSLVLAGRLGQRESRSESGGGGQVLIDAGAHGLGVDVLIREQLLDGRVIALRDRLVRSFRRVVEDVAAHNSLRALLGRGEDGDAAEDREIPELLRNVRGVGGGVGHHVVRRDRKEQAVGGVDLETRHERGYVRGLRRDERGLRRQAGEGPELLDALDGEVVGVLLCAMEELVDAQGALGQLFVFQPEQGCRAVEAERQREAAGVLAGVRKLRVCDSVGSAEFGAYEST